MNAEHLSEAASQENHEHHLSEDALDEILLEIASPAALAHAAGCALCTQRLDEFRTPLARFNQATLAWSEARSHAAPADLLAHRTPFRVTIAGLRYAGSMLVLALAFGLHTGLRNTHGLQAADSPQAEVNPGEIASDNAMLATIDSELTPPAPARFGLADDTPAAPARHVISRQGKD